MYTENWEASEAMVDLLEEKAGLYHELLQLKEENLGLKNTLKNVTKERDHSRFLRGLGAGIGCTPLAVWLAGQLMELMELCAAKLAVTPVTFCIIAVCLLTGLVLFFCSDMVCRGARKAGELFLASLELGDEEKQEGDKR